MAGTHITPSFRLDQPCPYDIVDNPIQLAGLGGGFEAHIDVRVLTESGTPIVETSVTNTNLTSQWQATVPLAHVPPSAQGYVEVQSGTGADEPTPAITVPITFGIALVHDYTSYYLYTVQPGDTLSSIAASEAAGGLYVTDESWQPIHRANAHIITDPDIIRPGMVLRIPSTF